MERLRANARAKSEIIMSDEFRTALKEHSFKMDELELKVVECLKDIAKLKESKVEPSSPTEPVPWFGVLKKPSANPQLDAMKQEFASKKDLTV